MAFKRTLLTLPTQEEIQACWELCRLHNNIGFWVVWLPTAWSITMAYHTQKDFPLLHAILIALKYVPLCFGVKSLIMTIDDILDADVDALVKRTKSRPIPRGSITLERAWLFFSLQVCVGVPLAFACLSSTALRVSIIVWPIYCLYPSCKRWTTLAPIPLGIMFSVGAFMGWADISDALGASVPWSTTFPIYIGSCLWTITYETVYQHQDKEDDVKIGLYSMALLLKTNTLPVCIASAAGFFGLLAYSGILNGHGTFFFLGIILAAGRLFGHIVKVDIDNPDDCKAFFLDNVTVGQIILVGMIIDVTYQRVLNGIII